MALTDYKIKYKLIRMTDTVLTDSSGSSEAAPLYLPNAESNLRPEVPQTANVSSTPMPASAFLNLVYLANSHRFRVSG